jgi:hypothetical protein
MAGAHRNFGITVIISYLLPYLGEFPKEYGYKYKKVSFSYQGSRSKNPNNRAVKKS